MTLDIKGLILSDHDMKDLSNLSAWEDKNEENSAHILPGIISISAMILFLSIQVEF